MATENHNLIDGFVNRINLNEIGIQIKCGPNKTVQITDDQGNGIQIATGGAVTLIGSGSFPGLNKQLYGTPLINAVCKNAYVRATASGNTDMYTVPAGKRAILIAIGGYNNSGGAQNGFPQVKISGTYFQLRPAISMTNAVFTAITPANLPYVAEAGETFAMNLATGSVNLYAFIIEFDAATKLSSAKFTSLATGDNIIYTAPANGALVIGNTGLNAFGAVGLLSVFNTSGANRTYTQYVIPNGQVKGSTTQVTPATIASSGTFAASMFLPEMLGGGDQVLLNVDAGTATQFGWLTKVEF